MISTFDCYAQAVYSLPVYPHIQCTTSCLFSCAWHLVLAVSPRMALIARFPMLCSYCRFYCPWHWLPVFCAWHSLPLFWTWHWLAVFLYLPLVACFQAFGTDGLFFQAYIWFWIFRSGQKPDLAMRMFMHTEDRIRMCVICMCNFQTFQSAPPAP